MGIRKIFIFWRKEIFFYLILLWIFVLQKVFCDFQNMNSNSKCFILKFQSLYLEFFGSWNDFDLISIQNNNKNIVKWKCDLSIVTHYDLSKFLKRSANEKRQDYLSSAFLLTLNMILKLRASGKEWNFTLEIGMEVSQVKIWRMAEYIWKLKI